MKRFKVSEEPALLFRCRQVNRSITILVIVFVVFLSSVSSEQGPVDNDPQVETIGLEGRLWNRRFRSSPSISDTQPSEPPFRSNQEYQDDEVLRHVEFYEQTIPLDVFDRPQHVFTIHGNSTRFNFNVYGPLFERSSEGIDNQSMKSHRSIPELKISVIIETMNCYSFDNQQGEVPPNLIIQWYNEDKMYNFRYCSYVDNTKNSFQTVLQVQDGMSNVSVFAEGNWKPGMNAKLVASIYTDVADSCGNCPTGYFCCGFRSNSCSSSGKPATRSSLHASYFTGYMDDRLYRCIPENIRTGGSLRCNGHPNCGFFCNADESRESCTRGSGNQGTSCFGGGCNMGEVALRIAILIVSCFLLPPLLILLLCRFQFIRRSCDSCVNFTLTSINGGRNDSLRRGLGSSAGESETDLPPGYSSPDSLEPPPYNVEEDPPPSYDEYLQSVKGDLLPPPVFSGAPIYTIQLTSPSRSRDEVSSTSHHCCFRQQSLPLPLPVQNPTITCHRCFANATCFIDSPSSSPPVENTPGGVINAAFVATE